MEYDEILERILSGELGEAPTYFGAELPKGTAQPNTQPAFFGEDWGERVKPLRPQMVEVQGGMPLLYPGKDHAIIAPSQTGKSFIVAEMVRQVVNRDPGATAVYIDYEDSRETLQGRLQSLGTTQEEAGRIAYWSPPESLAGSEKWLDWATKFTPNLVVIDSVAASMSGLNENSAEEYNRWHAQVVRPLLRLGIAVLYIDHTNHGAQDRASGSVAKTNRVWGASYVLRVISRFTQSQSGVVSLTVLKDRHGNRAVGSEACRAFVNVTPWPEEPEFQDIRISFIGSADRGVPATTQKMTSLVEKIVQLLTEAGGPRSQNYLRKNIVNSDGTGIHLDTLRDAIDFLNVEGRITVTVTGRTKEVDLVKAPIL